MQSCFEIITGRSLAAASLLLRLQRTGQTNNPVLGKISFSQRRKGAKNKSCNPLGALAAPPTGRHVGVK